MVLFCLSTAAVAGVRTAVLQPPDPGAGGRRIVAIGDVHGALDEFTGILRAAGLVDDRRRWTGGDAILVQTGDLVDRGPHVRGVLDLMMQLEAEARRSRGRVEALLGNHEVMNLLHDFRDASPETFASFADERSEERRQRAFDRAAGLARRGTGAAPLDREAWMRAHPPGFVEYSEALGPRGKYGRWLRDRKTAFKESDVIFMHAGIGPETPGGVDDVNKAVAREIAAWDSTRAMLVEAGLILPFFTLTETVEAAIAEAERITRSVQLGKPLDDHVTKEFAERLQALLQMGQSPLIAPEGPLWFRGYALWPPEQEPALKSILDRLGASRVVCGHTPATVDRITSRFGGRVLLIDTGMLSAFYNGRASALELQGGNTTAIYRDAREPVAAAAK